MIQIFLENHEHVIPNTYPGDMVSVGWQSQVTSGNADINCIQHDQMIQFAQGIDQQTSHGIYDQTSQNQNSGAGIHGIGVACDFDDEDVKLVHHIDGHPHKNQQQVQQIQNQEHRREAAQNVSDWHQEYTQVELLNSLIPQSPFSMLQHSYDGHQQDLSQQVSPDTCDPSIFEIPTTDTNFIHQPLQPAHSQSDHPQVFINQPELPEHHTS